MIDIRQVNATNESYLKERWIRMNWRKNYREKLAQKVKFRQDEINQAKNDMNDGPAETQNILQDIEESKPEVITIPTEASEPVEAPVASESSPNLSILRSATAKEVPSRRHSRVSSVASRKSSIQSSTHSMQSIPIKPVELIRSQVSSANSQRRNTPTSSMSKTRRVKSAYVAPVNQEPESIYLSGKRIPLADRETLWSTSVHVNKTTPAASKTYLKARKGVSPEQKYEFPHVSSFDYGWRLNDRISSYKPPLYGRSQTIQATFYRGSGVLRPQHSLY